MKTFFKSVNIWQSYKQERGCLIYFAHLANVLLKDKESARDSHVLTCNCAKLFTDLKKFTDRISFLYPFNYKFTKESA